VLGVDDFTQEFSYLSGRDQWIVAELLGYGTTSGLAIRLEDTPDGPRVHVSPGAAAVPSGKLVCIPRDQCGVINKWLAKPENAQKVNAHLTASPPLSPPSGAGSLSLYLTLCYADCLTAPAPIPGEPCRSDDELMAPSRVHDDYKLEFSTEPPRQTEEDALRDFVAWLKQVKVTDGGPSVGNESVWIAALRNAAQPWFASPPLSPSAAASLGDYLFGLPPASLVIDSGQFGAFLRVAFRFWVEELRPLWMTRVCGSTSKPDADCVLLTRLDVPVVWVGGSPTGAWQVDGHAASIIVDESRRPYLVHMRLLQEWLLGGSRGSSAAEGPTNIAIFETAAAALTLDARHHMVVCTGADTQTITLPRCAPSNKGRVYIVKNMRNPAKKLACDAADKIDSVAFKSIAPLNAFTVVSDGSANWHIIATVV
jgi:hypothetical protein